MGHGHGHHHQPNGVKLGLSVLLNLVITIAEFAGGLLSNSLALLSDAVHNLSDTLAIAISYVALKVGQKPANENKTYGYKRYEILTALFNATVLIAVSFYLFYEAYQRLLHPEQVVIDIMLPVAVIGLVANFISILLLHRDHKHNLNVKAAYLHLLGDTVSSVGVVLGGVAMHFWGWYWIDPVVTVLIGGIIVKHAYAVVKETVGIIVMATPVQLDLKEIIARLEQQPEVDNVHQVHCWRLDDHALVFDCHCDLLSNVPLSEADAIRQRMVEILHDEFSVEHATIQMEYNCCRSKKIIQ